MAISYTIIELFIIQTIVTLKSSLWVTQGHWNGTILAVTFG